MRTWTLQRHNESDFVFEGEHLITVDDREWLGVTPNWWELALYRMEDGTFVLGSIYFQNYPTSRTIHGALAMPTLDDVAQCLRQRCGAPDMIIEALLARARRAMRCKDAPTPPLHLDGAQPATPPCGDAPDDTWTLHA